MPKADSDRFSEVDNLLPYQDSDVILRFLLKVLRRMSNDGLLDDIRAKYLLDTFDEFDLGRVSQEQVQCAAVLALHAGRRIYGTSWPFIRVSNNVLSPDDEALASVFGIMMADSIVKTFRFDEKGIDLKAIEPDFGRCETLDWWQTSRIHIDAWRTKGVTWAWRAKWGSAYNCAEMCVDMARFARGGYRSNPWLEEAKRQVKDLFSIPNIRVV